LDNNALASLPGNIVFLEEEIERVVFDLGGEKFRAIPQASGVHASSLERNCHI